MNRILLAILLTAQSGAAAAQSQPTENYLCGGSNSAVKIDVFSDFECPACRAFFLDAVSPLIDEYSSGNKLAILFHDFPLSNHASSRLAARYSLAAKSLGSERYLKVVKYLYTCQAEWSYDGNVERILARVLTPSEMSGMKEQLNSPSIDQTIDREIALGKERKVQMTPTFFFTAGDKEQRVEGNLPLSILKEYISRGLRER